MESARTPSSFGEIRQDTAGRATFGSSVGVASATWAADSREWTTIGGQGMRAATTAPSGVRTVNRAAGKAGAFVSVPPLRVFCDVKAMHGSERHWIE